MNLEVEHSQDPQLAIAAVIHLLSNACLRGTNMHSCQALLQHLERLAVAGTLAPALRDSCAELYVTWAQIVAMLNKGGQCTCHDSGERIVH